MIGNRTLTTPRLYPLWIYENVPKIVFQEGMCSSLIVYVEIESEEKRGEQESERELPRYYNDDGTSIQQHSPCTPYTQDIILTTPEYDITCLTTF